MAKKFTQDFKHHFLRGLAAMLPTVLTLMILIIVFQFIQRNIGAHMDTATQWVVVQVRCVFGDAPMSFKGSPAEWDIVTDAWHRYNLQVLGIAMALLVIYVFGRLMASYIGRATLRLLDRTLTRLPFTKHLYPQIKQVTDYIFSDRKRHFSNVVAVEYPRRGAWSLGLVTANGIKALQPDMPEGMVTVFIPSSPTPMTGYTVTVSRSDVREMPLSVDEALRFTISGGVILPPGQQVGLEPQAAGVLETDPAGLEETES